MARDPIRRLRGYGREDPRQLQQQAQVARRPQPPAQQQPPRVLAARRRRRPSRRATGAGAGRRAGARPGATAVLPLLSVRCHGSWSVKSHSITVPGGTAAGSAERRSVSNIAAIACGSRATGPPGAGEVRLEQHAPATRALLERQVHRDREARDRLEVQADRLAAGTRASACPRCQLVVGEAERRVVRRRPSRAASRSRRCTGRPRGSSRRSRPVSPAGSRRRGRRAASRRTRCAAARRARRCGSPRGSRGGCRAARCSSP